MATAGEMIWAGLISGWKAKAGPSARGMVCRLTFRFGNRHVFQSPEVPISVFRLQEFRWLIPLRIRPVVTMSFRFLTDFDPPSEWYSFEVVWPHRWIPEKSGFTCVLPFYEWGVFFWITGLGGVGTGGKWRVFLSHLPIHTSTKGQLSLTPTQVLNKIRSGSLSVVGLQTNARVSKVSHGPFARKKSLRPNPEVKRKSYNFDTEVPSTGLVRGFLEEEYYRRDWSGTVTPNFGSKMKSQLPVNPHTVNIVRTDYSMGYRLQVKKTNPADYSNTYAARLWILEDWPAITTSHPDFPGLQNAALNKLNAKAQTGLQGNVALNLVQYQKTVDLIKDNLKRIYRSVKALRKGDIPGAINSLLYGKPRRLKFGPNPSVSKTLAQNWLALQYGWKPLLQDIRGAMVSYANLMAKNTSSVTVRASRKRVVASQAPIIFTSGGKSATVGTNYRRDELWVRYGVEFEVTDPIKAFLSQTGFTTPLNIAWEVLPFSFVIDWFLPIGPYLEAFAAPQGLKVLRGYKTLFARRESIVSVSYDGDHPANAAYHIREYCYRPRKSVAMARTALTSWPTPQLPSFKNPVSLTHVENAIALVVAVFKKR